MTILFEGKSKTESILLEDTPNPQLIKCPEDFITKNVKIIIKSTYQGSKYSDVAISYIGYVYKEWIQSISDIEY